MAKSMYIGVSDKSRKVKKAYVGIDNIARKIKKMYIGVAGVARLFFSSGDIDYHGTVTELGDARMCVSGASVGDYALFAGSSSAVGAWDVYVYNSSLTMSTLMLGFRMTKGAGLSFGDYAMFHGSYSSAYYSAFDASLTKTDINGSYTRVMMAAASVGGYALFAGGGSDNRKIDNIEVIDSSLTRQNGRNLSTASEQFVGTFNGTYAAFGTSETATDVFNSSLTRTTLNNSVTSRPGAATSVGDYLIFAGAAPGCNSTATVFAYDNSLTKISVPSLSKATASLNAASVNGFAIFAGGYQNDTVDVYDSSLTRVKTMKLSAARQELGAATVGNYALFAGGQTSDGSMCNIVDAFLTN